jgi:hypothetical protein
MDTITHLLVSALNDFVSYAFLWVLLLFCVQVDTDIGLVSARSHIGPESSYLL